jgi:hypothetical protein
VCGTTISRIGIRKIAGDDQPLRACRQRGDNCPLGRMLASTGWNGPGCGSECISHDCSVTMFLFCSYEVNRGKGAHCPSADADGTGRRG